MKNHTLNSTCLAVAAMLCCAPIGAAQTSQNTAAATAVPRLMHFAGSVHLSATLPAGPLGATFAIYSQQDGGTALWSEEQNVALDANGNYSVSLGSTKNEGVPVELFSAGEARWLQVDFHLPAEATVPRVLLVSVPYALKAADAETVGGLPPSAFMLAAPPASGGAGVPAARDLAASPSVTPALSGTGTADFIPIWTNGTTLGSSVLFQSGAGSTAEVGINTTTPAATLDVNGTSNMRGALTMAAVGVSTATAGKRSQPFNMTGSAFNTATNAAVPQTFRFQTEAANNGTSNPSGTLNLLYAAGSATPADTGLKIASNGQIQFAPGQIFPGGGGTVTSVGSGAGLTGGPITSSGTLSIATGGVTNSMLVSPSLTVSAGTGLTGGGVVALGGSATLSLDTTKVPLLSATNTFTGNQVVNGNLSATGVVSGSSFQIGSNLFAFGSYSAENALLGFAGNGTMTGGNNTASGVRALLSNGPGTDNTAVGANALLENSAGSYNTAIGSGALNSNIGEGNTATGYGAMIATTSGTFNTANGDQTLFTNTTGYYNTAMGDGALYGNTTGYGNTALGEGAIGANTTGFYNTAVGYVAGQSTPINYELSGSYNTFLGYSAGPTSQTPLVNATALGAHAAVGESNALTLGGTGSNAVTVGIGTTNPFFDYALDVEAVAGGAINGGVVANANGGNIYLGMTNGTHKFRVDTNGVAYADGGFQSSGADFAESFAVRGSRTQYEPGDVLEIDSQSNRHLTLSHRPYGTLVAGIYSTKPGMLASPHHIDDPTVQESEVPLAVVGIVPCKVTAENGSIARGDLLVTSSRPGYAMKGTNRRRMLGAVVGKALEPLPKGSGVIQVLVTLQ